MANTRLDLSNKEAELLLLALTTVINASSSELMHRQGWENVDEVAATTLIQSMFDLKDIQILSNIAAIIRPQLTAVDWDYSQHEIADTNTSVWYSDVIDLENTVQYECIFGPYSYHNTQFKLTMGIDSLLNNDINTNNTNNTNTNVVSLNAFRNCNKDNPK